MDVEQYFENIGLTGAFRDRAIEAVNIYKELFGDVFADVFVSEYVEDNGSRSYENLWLFNENIMCEAKQFLTVQKYDSAPIHNNVAYWEIKKENFDLISSTDKSRMILHVSLASSAITGDLKASGDNCKTLVNILKTYFITNTLIR